MLYNELNYQGENEMLNVIVNPRSLRGTGKRLLEKIEERLCAWGGEYRIFRTEKQGQATELARQLTEEGERTIVAMGGDGTMNDVLSGLTHTDECSLGLIPAGTGNDFATSAHIPFGMDALELILTSEAKPTDYIQFDDGRRSLNIAGLGIDVDVLQRCERMKGFHKKVKYFLSLLVSLVKYRGSTVSVETEGETTVCNALIAAVCNGKYLGGGIPLCPPAEVADGKMDLIVVDCPARRKILPALIKLMKGKILSLPFAHHTVCDRAVITPNNRTIAQYDGELREADGLAATIVKGKLKMFRG